MSGGNSYFEDVVVSIFLAFAVFVTIKIVNALDDKKLKKTLQETASKPGGVVDYMFLNHKKQVLQAGDEIVQRVRNGDKIKESNGDKIINDIFEGVQSNDDILDRVTKKAADALNTMKDQDFGVSSSLQEASQVSGEQDSGQEVTGETTLRTSPNVRPFLMDYIKRYEKAVQETNEKGKRKDGGSKKKKSKRKRGGSKKQQRRRSHKRR